MFVCLFVCLSLLRFLEKNRIKRFSERSNQYRVSQFTDFKKICKTQALSGSLSVSSFSLFVYLSLCHSRSLSVLLSLSLSLCLSWSLSVLLSLSLSLCLSQALFLSFSFSLFMSLSVSFCLCL